MSNSAWLGWAYKSWRLIIGKKKPMLEGHLQWKLLLGNEYMRL